MKWKVFTHLYHSEEKDQRYVHLIEADAFSIREGPRHSTLELFNRPRKDEQARGREGVAAFTTWVLILPVLAEPEGGDDE